MGGGGSSARYADARPTEPANTSMNTHGLVDNFSNYDNYNNYDNYIIIIKEIIIFLFIIMLLILLIILLFKCRKKK